MREDAVLSCEHPINKMNGKSICLFNIRSWNLHLEHFLSDKFLISNSCVLLFTETKTGNRSSVKKINDYCQNWEAMHHPSSEHGLAICYDTSKVNDVNKSLSTWGVLELLPVMMTIGEERVLIVLVYRPPGQAPTTAFVQSLIIEFGHLRSQISEGSYRTIVAGDFNLPGNADALNEVFPSATFHQRSQYSTHILGGILELVFDDKKSDPVEWIPSPYSDHFVIMFD